MHMAETISEKRIERRIDFPRIFSILFRPRRTFAEAVGESRPSWLTPMLILTLTSLLVVLVSGYLKTRAAQMGEVPLPPDWQYWNPEMQQNYMQAQQLTQGKTFMYVIPLVSAWASLWLGWVVLGGLLHLGSTLLGGRGSMPSALSIVAWANLPFAIRDVLRTIYMLSASHAITSPGLSGFATSGFLVQVLARTDLFLIWSIVLLIIGFAIIDGLPRGKAIVGVMVVIVLVLSAQAGLGALIMRLGGSVV
jgi:Yip1-like protein